MFTNLDTATPGAQLCISRSMLGRAFGTEQPSTFTREEMWLIHYDLMHIIRSVPEMQGTVEALVGSEVTDHAFTHLSLQKATVEYQIKYSSAPPLHFLQL